MTDTLTQKGRIVLIVLSLKHQNDWDKMYADILAHEDVGQEWLDQAKDVKDALTIIDTNYPFELRQCSKPPFVIYGVSTRK